MAKAGEGLFKRYIPKDIHEKVCWVAEGVRAKEVLT